MKNCFSKVVGQRSKIGVLAFLMVMGSQVSVAQAKTLRPTGGSVFAERCTDLYDNMEDIDACLVGKCDDLHPVDLVKFDACLDNGAAWIAENVIIIEEDNYGY